MDIEWHLLQLEKELQRRINELDQQMAQIETVQWALTGFYTQCETFRDALVQRLGEYKKTNHVSFIPIRPAEAFLEDWDD